MNDHKMRKSARPGTLVRAMCKSHFHQAARNVKGLKWIGGGYVRKNEIVVGKDYLKRIQIEMEAKEMEVTPAAAVEEIEEVEEPSPEPQPATQPATQVALVAEATDADSIMKRLLSELEASRGREERLLKIVEGSREPEREIAFGKRSEDDLAYEAGRRPAMLEVSENAAAKAGPSFSFAKPMVRDN